MNVPDLYLTYEEFIRKGQFDGQLGELDNVLQTLQDAARITHEQRESLLTLAREQRAPHALRNEIPA
jgi:hypothetical protein